LAVQGWRLTVSSIVIGVIAALLLRLLVEPPESLTCNDLAPGQPLPLRCREISTLAFYAVEGAFVGYIVTSVVNWVLNNPLKKLRDEAHSVLNPELWSVPPGWPKPTPRDHMRRLFVTTAAATGAVVGSMLGLTVFWQELWEQLSLLSISGVGLTFAAGMFLVGPAQAYVFEPNTHGQAADRSKEFSWIFAAGFDLRAALRLALVLMIGIAVGVLSNCLGESVEAGNTYVFYTIINVVFPPTIVSYYLCAALQKSLKSLGTAPLLAIFYAGAIMNYGTSLGIVSDFAMSQGEPGSVGDESILRVLPMAAIIVAFVYSGFVYAAPALAVAHVIEKDRSRTMYHVTFALLLVALAQGGLFLGFAYVFELPRQDVPFWTFIGSTLGWIGGLWVSGFPELLVEGQLKLSGSKE
jgi:hypothetical protein